LIHSGTEKEVVGFPLNGRNWGEENPKRGLEKGEATGVKGKFSGIPMRAKEVGGQGAHLQLRKRLGTETKERKNYWKNRPRNGTADLMRSMGKDGSRD